MEDKESLLKKADEALKEAAKAVEEFADKVAAPEVPPVLNPDPDATPKPSRDGKRDGEDT